MKREYCFLLLIFLVLFSSCAGTRTSVTQVNDNSYVVFIGKKTMSANDYGFYTENKYEAKIDDKLTFEGTHNIKVYRNGNLVINKNIYIGNQETMQIELL
jgi:hypothetical protein